MKSLALPAAALLALGLPLPAQTAYGTLNGEKANDRFGGALAGLGDLNLDGRPDFAQHYLLSALLSSQAGSRAANAIGLFKEVLDSTPGEHGSGFSFNDIAADLAGTRLGARARQEPVRLQFQATEAHRDTDWMPDVRDLPEFMTAEAVKQQYGGPGSPAFDRMWADIQQRVDRLPVLR